MPEPTKILAVLINDEMRRNLRLLGGLRNQCMGEVVRDVLQREFEKEGIPELRAEREK